MLTQVNMRAAVAFISESNRFPFLFTKRTAPCGDVSSRQYPSKIVFPNSSRIWREVSGMPEGPARTEENQEDRERRQN
jgi:hypothetical protein